MALAQRFGFMEEALLQFLGEIERDESRLLGWAVVDGSFTEDELRDRAEAFLDQDPDRWNSFTSGQALLEEMVSRRLLFRWDTGGGSSNYRTRMAETVRLMAGLKQLFPKHLKESGEWLTAPSLVSDFRFLNRPRSYPRRDQRPSDWIPIWADDAPGLSPLQEETMDALLRGKEGEYFPLGGFQVRATGRILEEVRSPHLSATMVCAGTGSGKTLAFYLPALTHLVGLIEDDSSDWVRALAIYPRNELLKDQVSETLSQTRRIRPVLKSHGRRALTIGTLFGHTPKNSREAGEKWRRHSGEPCICPFLVCPDCGSSLVWREHDREANQERLECQKCESTVESEEVVLTRQRIQVEPPDILFTTTEMMNQRMTDSWMWKLFGVGTSPQKKPAFLLLDEAHTYDGSHGAQVAYLLRRWFQRSMAKPHVVGLSATLMEAATFFSQLTGIPRGSVEEISPETKELNQIGMEYLLALRGDPVSGASLLSTSIQAAMLIRRTLDANLPAVSQGAYGKKVFLFTDDLDATNRMFFNLRDAEGQNSWGRPDPAGHPAGSLANLRSSAGADKADEERRFVLGQSWRISEEIGHQLNPSSIVPIDRVSSQDSGVAAGAEIIVATASLEVGFNDPSVGAVIQHKAPRDPASFLQRKGRAGRRLEMRPWTIVVLSDFGRDRLAYQGYDLLFDPELRPRDLPLGNRHVLKMQAVFSLMDWLGIYLGQSGGGHVWNEISQPGRDAGKRNTLINVIERVLAGEDELQRLTEWLKYSLHLLDEEVSALLWEPPRALMTSVIPTLHRRLKSQWENGCEQHQFWKPLPEFIPPNLFGGLNLPEIDVEAFASQRDADHGDPKVFPMRVDHALREFAPGRISKRFGIEHGHSRHWLPLDPDGPAEQKIDLGDVFLNDRWEAIGEFSYFDASGKIQTIQTIRPFVIRAAHDAPRNIRDSSNAFPNWNSQIQEPNDNEAGICIDLPSPSAWDGVIEEIRFFVHSQFCPSRIRRFTRSANASLQMESGAVSDIVTSYQIGDFDSVALGFAFEADAIRIRVCPPKDWQLETDTSEFKEKAPSLRASRYRWMVKNDDILKGFTNAFERTWLAEISLSAIVANAVSSGVSPEQAWASIRSQEAEVGFGNALDVIFQTIEVDDENGSPSVETKRLQEIRELFDSSEVIARLDALVSNLWSPIDEAEWSSWLIDRFLATLGAAFQEAIQQICPNIDAESLLIDIAPGPRDSQNPRGPEGTFDLWISETEPGGGGIIERFLPEIAEFPRRFLDLTTSALGAGDFEQADQELSRFLDQLADPEEQSAELIAAVHRVRSSHTLDERILNFDSLRTLLLRSGFAASHVVIAALNSRLLKPGSNPQTDELAWKLIKTWRVEESRLGIEVDARSLAYAMSASSELDAALSAHALPHAHGQDQRNWRFNTLYSLLWPRGSQARNHALSLRNPFAEIPETERFLVLDALQGGSPPISFSSAEWRRELEAALIEESRAKITCPSDKLHEFRKGILSLLANPIDTGSLLVYPRLRGIARSSDEWIADVEVIVPGSIGQEEVEEDDDSLSESRLIVKSAEGNREEVRDLLESLLAIELLMPGSELWLVSPWITDVPILDNRSGGYSGLDPTWPKRYLTLAELLSHLLERNTEARLSVITRPSEESSTARFCDRLQNLVGLSGNLHRLRLCDDRENLHTKGLVSDRFALSGSMNFTNNGISVLEETVQLQIDEQTVSEFLTSFHELYGGSETA